MFRASSAAAMVLSFLVAVRLRGDLPLWLRPFELGLAVWGPLTLGIAGLIWSSLIYEARGYGIRNAVVLGSLAATIAAGSVVGLAAVRSTGVTFLVLWSFEKLADMAYYTKGGLVWPCILAASLATWRLSLHLHQHPELLLSTMRW